jgi:hypothetical protein
VKIMLTVKMQNPALITSNTVLVMIHTVMNRDNSAQISMTSNLKMKEN